MKRRMIMAKNGHGVSSKTHTQNQRDHYANQKNPTTAHTEQTKTIMQISVILITRNIRIVERATVKSDYEVNLCAGLADKHQLCWWR